MAISLHEYSKIYSFTTDNAGMPGAAKWSEIDWERSIKFREVWAAERQADALARVANHLATLSVCAQKILSALEDLDPNEVAVKKAGREADRKAADLRACVRRAEEAYQKSLAGLPPSVELLATPVTDLIADSRIWRAVSYLFGRSVMLVSVGELITKTESQVRACRGIGPATYRLLLAALRDRGLSLAAEPEGTE